MIFYELRKKTVSRIKSQTTKEQEHPLCRTLLSNLTRCSWSIDDPYDDNDGDAVATAAAAAALTDVGYTSQVVFIRAFSYTFYTGCFPTRSVSVHCKSVACSKKSFLRSGKAEKKSVGTHGRVSHTGDVILVRFLFQFLSSSRSSGGIAVEDSDDWFFSGRSRFLEQEKFTDGEPKMILIHIMNRQCVESSVLSCVFNFSAFCFLSFWCIFIYILCTSCTIFSILIISGFWKR